MTNQQNRSYTDLAMFFLIGIAGMLLYAKTLQVPWLFDDTQNILDNPVAQNISLALDNFFGVRGLAYLTFALNYTFGGLQVEGFHLVNIAIHLCASWIVWLLAKRVFSQNGQQRTCIAPVPDAILLPGATAVLFLAHPIQTQAVNYIVQRMTTLSALLALVTLYAYCRARESRAAGSALVSPAHLWWYVVGMASMALACLTKQNAILITAEILLFDWLVLNRGVTPSSVGRRCAYLVPFLLISIFFIFQQVNKDELVLKEAGRADYWVRAEAGSATRNLVPSQPVPKTEDLAARPKIATTPPENIQALYLATEMTVLWKYLRLLFLPYGQVFDYAYPLDARVFSPKSILGASGLTLLFGAGLLLVRKRPLVAFGILWFFVTLSVESSIIPLDAMVEHRLYLPLFGFAVAVVDLLRSLATRRVALILLCLMLIGYTAAAMQRNLLWSDPIAFALDGRNKAPHNQRNHLTLATAYADAGKWAEAESALRRAIPLRPYHYVPYDNLGVALVQQGRFSEARTFFSLASLLVPEYPNAIYNYGYASLRMGDMPAALRSLERLKELRSPLANQLGAQFVNR